MTQKLINNFRTTVASTFGVADTLLQLTDVTGLPVLSGGDFYLLTLFRLSGVQESGHEVVKVTARTGNQCTVQRSYEGAAASQFLAGAIVAARITKLTIEDKADAAAVTAALATKVDTDDVVDAVNDSTELVEEKKGTSPASSATPDIWGAGGEYIPITQTADITGFPNAPRAGARRKLIIINPISNIVNGANLVVRGGTRALHPGDEVEIVADTVSTFHATIKRGSGLPVSSLTFLRAELYLSAATHVNKVSGPHRAILVGCGGSGAKCGTVLTVNRTSSATGGAAGGLAIKDYDGVAGDSYTYLPGVPGAAPTANIENGYAGTASTFTGPGVNLTANGGQGGQQSNTSLSQVPGAIGGTATGGDVNYQGGDSGSCAVNKLVSGNQLSAQATGGGAVSWSGTVTKSGDVESNSTGQASFLASGGASCTYKSGDVKPTGINGLVCVSGGAGTGGPSPDVVGNVNVYTAVIGIGKPGLNISPVNLIGTGVGASSGQGGGSSAVIGSGAVSLEAGAFGGSGAVIGEGSTIQCTVGTPGWGAGSGGTASVSGPVTIQKPGGISILIILS